MPEHGPFNVEAARTALETSDFWRRLVHVEQAGSTNDLAKALAAEGAPAGTVVVAEEQTAGRGRLERRWNSPPRTSLLCSLLFRPDLQPAQAHRLTMLCSMAAADAVKEIADLSVGLKWPNDLIVRSQSPGGPWSEWRKLAGILTESGVVNSDLAFVVVGIGINVNVEQDTLASLAPNATSILAETGRQVERWRLLVAFLEAVASRYERLEAGENPHDEWSARLVTLGQQVEVTTNDGTVEGVAEGVDEDGALLVRTRSGPVQRLLAADVTLTGS